jgi:hypothetical protein
MNLDRHERSNPTPFPVGLTVFGTSLLVYLMTTSPSVYLGDSGEFIAAAFCLGNPHNSGYPLYGLIGKVFSMIPIGNIAFRLNLMSAFFGALTAWLTYRCIIRITCSYVPAITASLLLAFSATFWSQTTCAEVYTLHAFFVALILALLFWWDQTRSLRRLLVFAFVVGLGFGNHMQTVMLAPAVLAFIIWSDRKVLFNVRHFLLLFFFFVLGLSVYLYLPIRTHAEAAIHWGDPDTLSRFMHHVGAGDHRHGYVLTKTWPEYSKRLLETVKETYYQFNLFWLFAALGWIKQRSLKWKVLWILLLFFDCIYTIFLNVISVEITAFQIPSAIVGTILIGFGMDAVLKLQTISTGQKIDWKRCLKPAYLCFPIVLFATNLYQNDQHENYTAYEYGTNVLRSTPDKATLLVEGDNILFPITYLMLAENGRPDLALYDRHNLFFKMPFLYREGPTFHGKWEELRRIIELELVRSRGQVYMAVFNDKVISDRGFDLVPHGITVRAVTSEDFEKALREEKNPWPSYATASLNGSFYRDYMNRTVTGYYFFKMARDLIFMDKEKLGLEIMSKASSIAYNDLTLHGDIATFYIDMGMLNEALSKLNIFSKNTTNLGVLHNMWGYYYSKTGDIERATDSFKRSIKANPRLYDAYRNLGLMYIESGQFDEAKRVFKQSLSLNPDQANLVRFMEEKEL